MGGGGVLAEQTALLLMLQNTVWSGASLHRAHHLRRLELRVLLGVSAHRRLT